MCLQVPIYVRALDLRHSAELKAAGADNVFSANTEAGMALGSSMLQSFGARSSDLAGLTSALRKQLDARALGIKDQMTAEKTGAQEDVPALSDVFVFDPAAVSGSDRTNASAMQSEGTALPRGQDDAAALGLQDAPLDQPAVSNRLNHDGEHQVEGAAREMGIISDDDAGHTKERHAQNGSGQSVDHQADSSRGGDLGKEREHPTDDSKSCPDDSRHLVPKATSSASGTNV